MKTIAVIQADLERTWLGTRSRLADTLRGTPVLRRTVGRVLATPEVEATFVLVPEAQLSHCKDMLAGLDVRVLSLACDPPPWARLVRASRKWALDGWRGGVGGATLFDEFLDCRALAGVLKLCPADAVLSVPPAAPLLDPGLCGEMVAHRQKHRGHARLTFTQVVPGLAGIVLDASLVVEMASSGIPISWLFTYKPDQPQKDLIFQAACLDLPAPLRFASGRLVADTDSAMELLSVMLAQRDDWTLAQVGAFIVERDEQGVTAFPREVEVELTTDDPLPNSILSPRGERLGRSGAMNLEVVRRIAGELSVRDDALCVLGGFGDPLCYADFISALEIFRPIATGNSSPKVFGLCVKTSGVNLTSDICKALIAHNVDILSVGLDAWTAGTFAKVKGASAATLEGICERLDELARIQQERASPTPIVVPEIVKAKDNVHEMDEFFDGWLRRCGAAGIVGYSHYAGQIPDRGVIDMRPPVRVPCRRLRTRCTVLSDGRVTLCDQDFQGRKVIGNLGEQPLSEIWRATEIERVRDDHRSGRFDTNWLCEKCEEWHRP